jgi:[ribosomal protein S5]-alanine N-acetyltransferase
MLNLKLETEKLYLISTSIEKLQFYLDNNLTNYYDWFGNEKVNQFNSHGLFPQSKKEVENYFDRCENDKSLLSFLIIEKETNQHIGMVSLQRIDLINRLAEFAIIIGETSKWGFGYSTESVKKLFEHGFNRLGLNRIWSGTSILNKGMIRSFEKLGMKHEGTYKQGQFLNGKFEDVVAYAILKEEFDNGKT